MLNYKPNVFAKNLRSSADAKLVAVCTSQHGYLEKAEYVSFLEELSASLRENFDIIFCTPPFGRISNADAIIAFNVTKETFYEIGNYNYIPLIAVNCLVEDRLFFQITADYAKLKRKADEFFESEYTYVCLSPADDATKAEITDTFGSVVFIESSTELQSIRVKNLLTTNGLIADFFKKQSANVMYEDLYSPLCRQTADCINKALSREAFDIHSYKV